MKLTEEEVVKRIKTALEELDGDEITFIHNYIVDKRIIYLGDSEWKTVEEETVIQLP